MKITPTMMKVLREIDRLEGCGANQIAWVLWPDTHRHMSLRAGQYMGRLCNLGLVRKRANEYTGKRGQRIFCSMTYSLTTLARDILRSER